MAKDYKEVKSSNDSANTFSEPVPERTQRSVQGIVPDEQTAPRPDYDFVDRQGRDITLRTFENGNSYYIRAYDRTVVNPPERPNPGQAGAANVLIQDTDGQKRARLQDIEVPLSYRENGIGEEILKEAEGLARNKDCQEIYGLAPDDDKTRQWYEKRGYTFRQGQSGGSEVYKLL